MKRTQPTAPAATRAAFTVIELLIVIVVIGILVALLLPAVSGARTSARVAQVTSEIKNLEKAIADFKLKYGVEPPSRIRLCESPGEWVPATPTTLSRKSQAYIRQIWPQFDFDEPRDINGDGDQDDVLDLAGAECLVFFLGGVCETNVVDRNGSVRPDPGVSAGDQITWWAPMGFSANPADPFARGGGNRVGPFFEFDGGKSSERMVNIRNVGQGMPEYKDPVNSVTNAPYLYVSSYGGRGYIDTDLDLGGNPTLGEHYKVLDTDSPQKPNSFQIISPGFDGLFGPGGGWGAGERLPVDRKEEWDNITNFSGGMLTQ